MRLQSLRIENNSLRWFLVTRLLVHLFTNLCKFKNFLINEKQEGIVSFYSYITYAKTSLAKM